MSYLPSCGYRLYESLSALRHVMFPPALVFEEGDALVVCDPIEAYRDLYSERSLRVISSLIRQAQARGVPVIYTRWVRTDQRMMDAVDAKGHWSEYVHERDGTHLLKGLPVPDDVIHVRFANAFVAPRLSHYTQRGKRLILAGGWVEACILATARGALEHNIRPVVVADAAVGHALAFTPSLVQFQLLCGEVVCAAHRG